MVYNAKNAQGEIVNTIEIDPAQVVGYAALTGLTLEALPTPAPVEEVDWQTEYINLAAEYAALSMLEE